MTRDEWLERRKRERSSVLTWMVSRLNSALERAIYAIEGHKSRSARRVIAERERKRQH